MNNKQYKLKADVYEFTGTAEVSGTNRTVDFYKERVIISRGGLMARLGGSFMFCRIKGDFYELIKGNKLPSLEVD